MDDDELDRLDRDHRLLDENALFEDPKIQHFPGAAGAPIGNQDEAAYDQYRATVAGGDEDNPYAPFASKLEWEIAKWAKMRGPTSTAFTELLKIEGVIDALKLSFKSSKDLNAIIDGQLPPQPTFRCEEIELDGEKYEVHMRDTMEVVRMLYSNPEFLSSMTFAPERHFSDDEIQTRMFNQMHTGNWWWGIQELLEARTPGATVVPIILSSDKTQVTVFRNQSAYPVYLTIGNISSDVQRKPSKQAQILVGYLPTARLTHIKEAETRRRAIANLFHACMRKIMEPIRRHGRDGIPLASGDGVVQRCHPIFAAFVGDYPEQCLVTCVKNMECPKCDIPRDALGSGAAGRPRKLAPVLNALNTLKDGTVAYVHACQAAGIKPVYQPFWQDLPYANVFQSITPDVLHQLYQGMIKHILAWVKKVFSAEEIDARARRLPRNHNTRLFSSGISHLSRVSGQEHRDICRILLGLVIGLPLPGGLSSNRLVRAVRALLDFLHLAQYPSHTTDTLKYLDKALKRFHADKAIFLQAGVREHFNLPKLHVLIHYTPSIKLFGTTGNYNTEATERLHIDYAKDAYRASNHKDAYPQMTRWLHRREQVLRHERFIQWRVAGSPIVSSNRPPVEHHEHFHIARFPNFKSVRFTKLAQNYGAREFENALLRFIWQLRHPEHSAQQIRNLAEGESLPFKAVATFNFIKFWLRDAQGQDDAPDVRDSAHARPAYRDTRNRVVPGRFDTVLVDVGGAADSGVQGYRVAQVRAVFSLSIKARESVFPDGFQAPKHMAYVEWFSHFAAAEEDHHRMYKVSRSYKADGRRQADVVAVADIRRSVHLFPRFGRRAPRQWTSATVLEQCDHFYVSSFTDRHTYITVY
ncbi:hypothetical protein FA95DRAFT_1504731 [Auriscalpium vulgare]|uniref:Uncharacterized protein n=1 Tax=Auriscalpium vulgare TaxID=40419 RepID=A0ACB8R5I6_9AGAM|nr:hypothetical protein FA95DRAFT_1504731 [Auriscalpium vulgare]